MVSEGQDTEPAEEAREPSVGTTPRRYFSIDILRALAILFMIQVHAVDNLSRKIVGPPALSLTSQIFGHMAAPLFALLSGLSYFLWLSAQKSAGRSTDEIVKYSLRRGMFLFALGLLVNFFLWLPDAIFDWDILALIGAAAIILTGMRNWHPGVLIALCIPIFLASPILRDAVHYGSYWAANGEYVSRTQLNEILLGLLLNAYFPLLPWLIYPIVGFVLGQIFYRGESGSPLWPSLALAGLVILAVGVAGALAAPYVPGWFADYYATGWPKGFYPPGSVFILISIGLILVCLWLMNRAVDVNPRITGTGAVLVFFRRFSYFALTAYVVHLAVQLWPMWILAWWEGRTKIDYYAGRFLPVPQALLSALILIVVLYLVFIVLDRHRKYSLEYFMRWICR